MGTVYHNEYHIVLKQLLTDRCRIKNLVAYINNRVEIRYDDLLSLCEYIVEKFYIYCHTQHHTFN